MREYQVCEKIPIKNGVILNAQTGEVVRMINLVYDQGFISYGQSFTNYLGKIVALVETDYEEVRLISFN